MVRILDYKIEESRANQLYWIIIEDIVEINKAEHWAMLKDKRGTSVIKKATNQGDWFLERREEGKRWSAKEDEPDERVEC